jgi:hypothetical protein
VRARLRSLQLLLTTLLRQLLPPRAMPRAAGLAAIFLPQSD